MESFPPGKALARFGGGSYSGMASQNVIAVPFAGITRIRFHGYDLSPQGTPVMF
jgi:hypothetical protein